MKKIILILLGVFLFTACKENTSQQNKVKTTTNTKKIANKEGLKSIITSIEGMTCEIGCAKTIESKLSKMEGVTFANVNFEAKEGKFTYDASKISAKDIENKINKIAGGDVYKVTNTKNSKEIFSK